MANDPFWSNLFRRRTKSDDALVEILKEIPIFQDLSRREFQKLEAILHRRSFAPDEAIVREGEVGVGMYTILSGEVEIVQKAEEGGVLRLATFGPGDFFGEQALLDEESPRTASAIAVQTCKAVGFFRPDLLELIQQNPQLGLKIIMRLSQMVSARLRHTNRLLKEARAKADELALAGDGEETPAEEESSNGGADAG